MEFPNPKPSVVVASALIVVLVHVMAAGPGMALKLEPAGTSTHIPPLLDCAPAPSNGNLSAFRVNMLSLLGALPAAAATAPTAGFAAAQSMPTTGGGGGDRAFARAFCFGFGARRGSSPDSCLECLSAAAVDVAGGCHGRRGAVWRAGCFLSFADTNASTPREDAFRGWFYDGDGGDDAPTAALGRECVGVAASRRSAAEAECSRCQNESANVVPALGEGRRRRLSSVHGDAVVVVGYSCYVRVPLFPPMPRWETYVFGIVEIFDLVVVVLIEVSGILFCINNAQDFDPA